MKVLWIVNGLLEKFSRHLFNTPGNGLWMDAMLDSFADKPEYNIFVATTLPVKKTVRYEENNVTYYALPDNYPILYNENDKGNIKCWNELLNEVKPDVIQVWGTEFTHGLCALRAAKNIPSVIYMQGYLGSIARHYLAGLTHKEIAESITLRDILKRDGIERQQRKYYASAEKEKEMLSLSGRIICENDWCENSIRAVVPSVKVFRSPLSINRVFTEKKWDIANVERCSIICTASGYPLKGLHILLKALPLIKKEYPSVKLYIPGPKVISENSFVWKLRKNGYTKYIERLIRRLKIEDSIVWMGIVAQEKLAEQYSKTHVFVLTSSIENHSSSLKEAMMVGIPSIATYVGGVPEYVNHGENGLLYRFEEYEIMAQYVKNIFANDALAEGLSTKGRESAVKLHESNDIFTGIASIYNSIISESNENE